MSDGKQHSITFNFPLASPSHASIIRRALQVDKPRNPKEASTLMDDVEGGLQMMSCSQLFDNLDLIVRTIDAFGSPLPPRDDALTVEGISL